MDDTLFKAVLAMDSYNRGYDAGIKFGGGAGTYSDDSVGTSIGTASISANRGQQDAQDIGFYALAYDYNGSTIISYRGTDDFDSPADLLRRIQVGSAPRLARFDQRACGGASPLGSEQDTVQGSLRHEFLFAP